MAIRILFLILGILAFVNIVIFAVGLIMNVNLYQKHGKAILNIFLVFVILIVVLYIVLGILGLI